MNATIEIKTDSETVQKLLIQPGGDKALFYSGGPSPERLIGHLRMNADNYGKLWTSWWPHEAAQKYNREPFKSEFDALINALQRELFCQPETMMSKLLSLGIPSLDDDKRYRFFHVDTEAYSYYFRVYPGKGDYSYCYCYVRGEV